MSELQHEDPFKNIGCEVVDSLNDFDESRLRLYNSLSAAKRDQLDVSQYQEETDKLINYVSGAFSILAMQARRSSDSNDEAMSMISVLWLHDDNQRVDYLSDLLSDDQVKFKKLDNDDTEKKVDTIFKEADSEGDLARRIFHGYRGFLAGDVKIVTENLQARIVNQAEAPEPEKVIVTPDINKVRQTAIDATGFAIAVSFGYWLSKRFNK